MNNSAFDGGSWSRLNIGTIGTGQSDPDGGSNAEFIPDNTTNSTHSCTQNPAGLSAVKTIARVRAKASTADSFVMVLNNLGIKVRFNCTAGSKTTTAGSPTATYMDSLGSGWYLCAVEYTWSTSGITLRCVQNTTNLEAYVGTGTGVLLYKAELYQ